MTTNELLGRYAVDHSETAFAELVRRHIDLVYSSAFRQLDGDAAAAQDVTQGVFTALAQQAPRLTHHTSLTGWLFTTTRNLAAKERRTEHRRRVREQDAHLMNQLLQSGDLDPTWREMRPLLDEVLHELNAGDRETLLLRYFEHLSLAQIGARLGLAENAARMRVDRALDKLRAALAKRGVTSTVVALAAMISERAVLAAPAGLAAQVTQAALGALATSGGLSLMHLIVSANAKWITGIGAVVVVSSVLLIPGQLKSNQGDVITKANEQASASVIPVRTIQTAGPSLGVPVAVPASSTISGVPIIQFNTENYDSGKTLAGTPINYTFQVTNAGDGLLEISAAHGSCSCTTTSWTKEIAAHQTGEIPIVIQTQPSQRGPADKTVTVTSNDPKRPNVTLHVHLFTWMPIDVTPSQTITFSVMPDGSAIPSQTLHITSSMDEPLVLSPPASDSPAFSAVLKTNVPGKEYELTVAPNAASLGLPGLQTRSLSGTISMQTSATNLPVLKINASALIYPEIFYSPYQIQLPRGPLSQPSPNWIQVRDNTGRGLTLSDPSINVPGVDISVKVMTANRQYALVVNFPPGFELQPGSNVVATVKTDNPRYPIITVPVFAAMGAPGTLQPLMRVPPPGIRLTNGQMRPFLRQPVPTNTPHP